MQTDPGALAREQEGGRPADALTGTGDERDLVRQPADASVMRKLRQSRIRIPAHRDGLDFDDEIPQQTRLQCRPGGIVEDPERTPRTPR